MPSCREPYLYFDLLSSMAFRCALSCCIPEKYVYPPKDTRAVEPDKVYRVSLCDQWLARERKQT